MHESIYDKFVAKAKELAEGRKVGDPFKVDTAQGPQVIKIVDVSNEHCLKLIYRSSWDDQLIKP